MKLVIAISSALAFEARREICRQSWLKQLPHPDVAKVFFGLGEQAPQGEATGVEVAGDEGTQGCVTFLECPDDYRALCLKTQEMMRVAIESDADWVFKCDDDTFVHVGRLVQRAKDAEFNMEEYIGCVQGGPPFAEGGAGYLLSRQAAEVVAGATAPEIGMEDAWVGTVMKDHRIRAIHDKRFVQRGNMLPLPGNDLITGHPVRSHTMGRQIQKAFEEAGENPSPKGAIGK